MGVKEKLEAIRPKKEIMKKLGKAWSGPCYKQFVKSEL
jgi:hypothetical protein